MGVPPVPEGFRKALWEPARPACARVGVLREVSDGGENASEAAKCLHPEQLYVRRPLPRRCRLQGGWGGGAQAPVIRAGAAGGDLVKR